MLVVFAVVALVVLEPWTTISAQDGISGFASPATITVLAMFIISEGIRLTGVVQLVGDRIVSWTEGDATKQLASVVGLSGVSSGFVNNTPVVAVMIPMATNIVKQTKTLPSSLLLPISFASMMGGTLTLIGTSTDTLATDVWNHLGGDASQPFTMFTFATVGIVVLAGGSVYLLT